jgi:streptomycin 6-kinase
LFRVTLPIPDAFAQFMITLHGEAGAAWLAALPQTLAACEAQWQITLGPPFPNLSYHYVAPGIRADGLPVVVKACSPTGEFAQEAAALRIFDGHGMAQLLATDDAHEIMLLERLLPGDTLATLQDDDAATRIAAGVMQSLWQPVPEAHPFATVADWRRGLDRLRQRYDGGTGPIPADLVARAERLFAALQTSAAPPVVLHGDVHHNNILAAQRAPWLAIDPKGLIGEPAYEIGPMLWNPRRDLLLRLDPAAIVARRIAILSEMLEIDQARLYGWALYESVLSAWWDIEDTGQLFSESLDFALMLAGMNIDL